jgi:serine/threonine protein kinase
MAGPDARGRLPSTSADSPEDQSSETLDATKCDERLESPTAQAPSFRPVVQAFNTGPSFPSAGEKIGDFELVKILGTGSFARVYLAHQMTLNREVALKVTANRGCEARTLARLEHDHIVQVFSETLETPRNLRLLCMQLVPGTTLARIISSVQARPRHAWSGKAILEAIDELTAHAAAFHPAALRDREMLEDADYYQAVCWLLSRLAEALDYAHSRKVLHRDIKPANILVNHYGRPFLADFNLSLRVLDEDREHALFGGTLAYMSPEHLDAFRGAPGAAIDAVCERADIYSLGMVLFEMLAGERAFGDLDSESDAGLTAEKLAEARRSSTPSVRKFNPDVPEYLEGVVSRCLMPKPEDRYATASVLARSLDGCRELRRIQRELPPAGPITRLAMKYPFSTLVAFAVLPHVLGSVVNISYNELQIAGDLTSSQKSVFLRMVVAYNLVVYPFCLWACYRLVAPVWRAWRDRGTEHYSACQEPTWSRRRALSLPLWMVVLACVGWLPGGILFPAAISYFDVPLDFGLFSRFVISFTLSGLIALTYSFFGLEFVVLRILYPYFWPNVRDIQQVIAQEIRPHDTRLKLFQLLAGVIPLAGAFLLVVVGPEVSSGRGFRLLLTGLIVLGMVGFGVAMWVNQVLSMTLAVLTRRQGRPLEWSRYMGRSG